MAVKINRENRLFGIELEFGNIDMNKGTARETRRKITNKEHIEWNNTTTI